MSGETTSSSISQGQTNAFGLASGGTGLIHTDPDYARKTAFGAPLVQGLYLFALIEKHLADRESQWLDRGLLEVTFVGPVRVDQGFSVETEEDLSDPGRLAVTVRTGDGDAIVGRAWVRP